MKNLSLKIQGMSCASCASKIEQEVSKIKGVNKASVNFAVETGKFEVDSIATEKEVKSKIIELGYTTLLEANLTNFDKKDKLIDDSFNKFFISIILSVILFALAMWPLKD